MKLDGLFASNNVNVIRVFFIYIKYSFLMKLDGLFASSNVNTIRVYIYIYIKYSLLIRFTGRYRLFNYYLLNNKK